MVQLFFYETLRFVEDEESSEMILNSQREDFLSAGRLEENRKIAVNYDSIIL